jgi:hypothetical protein
VSGFRILDNFKHQQALHKYPYLKGEIILEMDGFCRSEPVVLRNGPSSFTGKLKNSSSRFQCRLQYYHVYDRIDNKYAFIQAGYS